MTARQVILLRHGLTDWNAAGRFQGQSEVPLNQQGLEQAAKAAAALVGRDIGAIVSSDLGRARATANIVAERLGLPVSVDARLQEINVGSWAGLPIDEVAAANPDFRPAILAGRDFRRSPTGETGTQAGERVASAISEHAAATPDSEVLLIVGHGMTTRVASLLLIGLEYAHTGSFVGLGNCQWVVLKPEQPYWRMVAYNRTS